MTDGVRDEEAARAERDEVTSALRGPDADAPRAFAAFAEALRPLRGPDFTEVSFRIGADPAPRRLVHYFDLARNGEDAVAVLDALARMTRDVGFPLPPTLAGFLHGRLASDPALAQLVLGVDARTHDASSRFKLYASFSGPAQATVREAISQMGLPAPMRLDPAEVFLVGFDFAASGPSDLKLYLRLDLGRLGRVVRNLPDFAPMVRASGAVVLQQCLGGGARRQLHFHSNHAAAYAAFLESASESVPALARTLVDVRVLAARLPTRRLESRIVGLAYEHGTLSLGEGNLYYHSAGQSPR